MMMEEEEQVGDGGGGMIRFTYERVNYSKECVNTYSLRGIWRRRQGDKRHADNEFAVSPPLSPVGLAFRCCPNRLKRTPASRFFYWVGGERGGGGVQAAN